jgi:flagellar biosynthetic protein FlhB
MAEEAEDSAAEKTEEPSAHRLEELRNKGDVAWSRDLNNVLGLAGTLFVMLLSISYIYEIFGSYIEWLFTQDLTQALDEKRMAVISEKTFSVFFRSIGPICITAVAISVLATISQIGFLFATDLISTKLERINPINGVKRLFTMRSIAEALKGVFKLLITISVTYVIINKDSDSFSGFLHTDVLAGMVWGKSLISKLGYSIIIGLFIVALGDFAYQKISYRNRVRMTREELKKEAKEHDGNPEIKQKIKTIQRQMAQKRLKADVKKADVIVTNPTHISVALRYDPETMVSPVVLAKGADHVAMKIREMAKEFDIPIVENITLARTLYKTVKTGASVPRTLYRAIAEVIAFVYRLKRKKKALS